MNMDLTSRYSVSVDVDELRRMSMGDSLIGLNDHYKKGKVECIDAIESALTPEEFRGFLKGNVIKYTWREQHKQGVDSLKKAKTYLNKLINGTWND